VFFVNKNDMKGGLVRYKRRIQLVKKSASKYETWPNGWIIPELLFTSHLGKSRSRDCHRLTTNTIAHLASNLNVCWCVFVEPRRGYMEDVWMALQPITWTIRNRRSGGCLFGSTAEGLVWPKQAIWWMSIWFYGRCLAVPQTVNFTGSALYYEGLLISP